MYKIDFFLSHIPGKTITRSYEKRTGVSVSGFISFSVFNSVNLIASLFAPVVISLVGRKLTICVGGLLQASYYFTYIKLSAISYNMIHI